MPRRYGVDSGPGCGFVQGTMAGGEFGARSTEKERQKDRHRERRERERERRGETKRDKRPEIILAQNR